MSGNDNTARERYGWTLERRSGKCKKESVEGRKTRGQQARFYRLKLPGRGEVLKGLVPIALGAIRKTQQT